MNERTVAIFAAESLRGSAEVAAAIMVSTEVNTDVFESRDDASRPVAVIDIKASSYPVPGSYPLEVALAFVDTGASKAWLIRPPNPWAEQGLWAPAAEKVQGIPKDMLLAHGRPIEEVRTELEQAAAGHAVLSDAVTSDSFWLHVLYDGSPPFALESLGHVIRQLTEPLGAAGRDAVINAVNAAHDRFPNAHRAEPDAQRWAEVVRILGGLA